MSRRIFVIPGLRRSARDSNGYATITPLPRRAEGPTGVPARPRVAYIMSRFPKITETFILFELLAVEKQGVHVDVFPLLRERQDVVHPEAVPVVDRAHFHPFVSLSILWANVVFLFTQPWTYVRTIAEVLFGTVRSVNFFVGALGILPKSVRFAYEMRRLGVTHVHAHFATHPAVAALVIHRLTGIPFSFTAHGSDLHVDRCMLGRKVEAAAFAVTISEFNKNVILDECGETSRDKIRVVHCGVDPSVFTPREHAPTAQDGAASTVRLLCVASYEEVKGHRYLIEACALLRDRGVNFRLDLIGDGPCRADVEQRLRDARLSDRVHMHGAQPRDAVLGMMAAADIMCLPSVPTAQGKREGIPVVLMEAMACAVPVVSSQLSGIPELVQDEVSGLLVPPRDAAGLADALERLAGDPETRARMGQAGRTFIELHFNLHANAARLARLFAGGDDTPPDATRYVGSIVGSIPPRSTQTDGGDAPCSK